MAAEAAICLATIACIAGANVEKCQALPYIKAKDQVIIPKHSRNPYDMGVRMVGAEIVEVETPDEMRAKISPRTAMIYVMSDPRRPKSVRSAFASHHRHRQGKERAGAGGCGGGRAAQSQHPSAAGATLVCYSGGKCLRGPQSSGMLLGNKDLCKAAYFQAAPHHCYGRALKCSKEETMGLLAAVTPMVQARPCRRAAHVARLDAAYRSAAEAAARPPASNIWSRRTFPTRRRGCASIGTPTVLGITGTELVAKLDAGTPAHPDRWRHRPPARPDGQLASPSCRT